MSLHPLPRLPRLTCSRGACVNWTHGDSVYCYTHKLAIFAVIFVAIVVLVIAGLVWRA